ncbi:MAG: MBL fold metallo-hydrolase [Phycisphaeraceae bacterium]
MSLLLTFLGTGTSAGVPMIGCDCAVCRSADPRDHRSRPSVMVTYPQTQARPCSPSRLAGIADESSSLTGLTPDPATLRRLIIDTTPEFRLQMVRHRINRIDGVLYTHAHADHIFGVDDLRRFNAVMHAPIDIYCDQPTLTIFQQMFRYIFESHNNVNQSFIPMLVAHVLEGGATLDLFGATWTAVPLLHGRLPILGFRVDLDTPTGRQSLAYCTDVSEIPEASWPMLADLDVLVIDALRYRPHPTHLTVEQALAVIERLSPRRSYFTHIAHDIRHAELAAKLPANVFLSYDGLEVDCAPAVPSMKAIPDGR